MDKFNLPVMLLKGIVLLPNNDIRLELDKKISDSIIDESMMFHNGKLLIVHQTDYLEETFNIKELPHIGIVSKITNKMQLPNGRVRVIISGLYRTNVIKYLSLKNDDTLLDAIVKPCEEEFISEREEETLIKKLYREIEDYVNHVPYISNSILAILMNTNSLSKMTDIIVPNLNMSLDRMTKYLNETKTTKRNEMLLSDIYKEKENFEIEKELDLRVKKSVDSNQREYILREKLKTIKEELGDISAKEDEVEKLRLRIEELDAPIKIKDRLNSELKRYENLSSMSPEVNIVRNYIDWLLDLPWNIYTNDNEDLKDVRKCLDDSHYGLDKVKTRIIEYLAVKTMTNSLRSPIICLVGPPGVGKTSLAFSIAEAIKRNFVKMSVGGVNDESEIKGHRRTYLGANPGRIIQSMKKAKSSNPVFLIDEIDKMTKDIKGDPASCLLEVLDPEQNKLFSDNYIEEEYDLSKVMFITTANSLETIPEALRDRLEIVNLSGYTEYEKIDIVKKHLLKKICEEHGISVKKIEIPDEVILEIIRSYTREAGVRELQREIASIIRKIVTMVVTNNIKFQKVTITNKELSKYLGKPKYNVVKELESLIGVVNGLAYTNYGGDTLPIEVSYYKGTGKLELTGSLGDVMKESASIALSYLKSNYKNYNIDYNNLIKNDIHIHVPEGAVPKDGPSAGIALTSALVSAFSNMKVSSTIAMTGEMTLRGNILPIGGLKEKSIGAHRNGIKKIIIPKDNLKDLDDIPKEIKNDIKYIPVNRYDEVYNIIKEN